MSTLFTTVSLKHFTQLPTKDDLAIPTGDYSLTHFIKQASRYDLVSFMVSSKTYEFLQYRYCMWLYYHVLNSGLNPRIIEDAKLSKVLVDIQASLPDWLLDGYEAKRINGIQKYQLSFPRTVADSNHILSVEFPPPLNELPISLKGGLNDLPDKILRYDVSYSVEGSFSVDLQSIPLTGKWLKNAKKYTQIAISAAIVEASSSLPFYHSHGSTPTDPRYGCLSEEPGHMKYPAPIPLYLRSFGDNVPPFILNFNFLAKGIIKLQIHIAYYLKHDLPQVDITEGFRMVTPAEIAHNNWKGTLTEYCMKNRLESPVYTEKNYGPPHLTKFMCSARIGSFQVLPSSRWPKKVEAQQASAFLLFTKLKENEGKIPVRFTSNIAMTIQSYFINVWIVHAKEDNYVALIGDDLLNVEFVIRPKGLMPPEFLIGDVHYTKSSFIEHITSYGAKLSDRAHMTSPLATARDLVKTNVTMHYLMTTLHKLYYYISDVDVDVKSASVVSIRFGVKVIFSIDLDVDKYLITFIDVSGKQTTFSGQGPTVVKDALDTLAIDMPQMFPQNKFNGVYPLVSSYTPR